METQRTQRVQETLTIFAIARGLAIGDYLLLLVQVGFLASQYQTSVDEVNRQRQCLAGGLKPERCVERHEQVTHG